MMLPQLQCLFRYCLDGTVWTPPLVVLVICCASVLVFLAIIFIFVYVETRRASGKVAPRHRRNQPPIITALEGSVLCIHSLTHILLAKVGKSLRLRQNKACLWQGSAPALQRITPYLHPVQSPCSLH